MEQKLTNPLQTAATETIAAIATPPGKGGIAVIRVSGPQAFAIADRMWKGKRLTGVKSHTVHLGIITDSEGNILDQAVATVFCGPNSFTGEDTVEFSIHGGRWLQQAVMSRLAECGARPARAGEFSQRAYLNGRLDLAQAEGIVDLIAAESQAAARLAVSQTTGSFSAGLDELRQKLIDFASMLELELDFSEEDVEFADRNHLQQLCTSTLATVRKLARSFKSGKMFKEGIPSVISGAPNAGKSTLLNRLSGDDLAIVSDIPGTTRDLIEARVEIGGTLFRFVDTAGIRENATDIELEGIERARRKIRQAALLLWIVDVSSISDTMADRDIRAILSPPVVSREGTLPGDCRIIVLLNKIDKTNESTIERIRKIREEKNGNKPIKYFEISAFTGEGIEELENYLAEEFSMVNNAEASLIVSNVRHYEALLQAEESLQRASEGISSGLSADFIAQDVREATDAIGTITGAIPAETLLQTIFSRFCIGK